MKTGSEERRDRIIETVAAAYMETGEPVSSAYVAHHCGLGLSPASIRAAMKELEDTGFLHQPHTSAGRIPTVKGYRYYVRRLMPELALPEREQDLVRTLVERIVREHDADMFMEHVARVLATVTDLIGVVMAPSFDRGLFERLEILDIGGGRYLFVISLAGGVVKTISLRVDRIAPRRSIGETARLITERLGGLSIAEIKRTITARLQGIGGDHHLVDVVLDHSDTLFRFTDPGKVYVAGISRLLTSPEVIAGHYSHKLADIFEDRSAIAEALVRTAREERELDISIGGSEPWGANPPLSLVSAMYRSDIMGGALGVIGPAHICYPKLSAVVRYAATLTAHLYGELN